MVTCLNVLWHLFRNISGKHQAWGISLKSSYKSNRTLGSDFVREQSSYTLCSLFPFDIVEQRQASLDNASGMRAYEHH